MSDSESIKIVKKTTSGKIKKHGRRLLLATPEGAMAAANEESIALSPIEDDDIRSVIQSGIMDRTMEKMLEQGKNSAFRLGRKDGLVKIQAGLYELQ